MYTYLDLWHYKRNNVYFQKFSYYEDSNPLYMNYHETHHIKMHSSLEIPVNLPSRFNSDNPDKFKLVKFFIRAVNNEKNIYKSYQKLPEFLASISGLLVNLLMIMSIIMRFINEFKARQHVMSKIIKYKDLLKENNQETLTNLTNKFNDKQLWDSIHLQKNRRTLFIGRSFNNGNSINSFNIKESDLKDKMIDQQKFKKSNPYYIYMKDIFLLIFCCRNISKKKIIYDKAKSKFDYNIDLITFMIKMQEIDIIKYLLLDINTLTLMNFISKPSISMNNDSIDDVVYRKFFIEPSENSKSKYDNIDELKESYVKIISKHELTQTEKRILDLFEMQVNEIVN